MRGKRRTDRDGEKRELVHRRSPAQVSATLPLLAHWSTP
jgi:hypothetical protein